MSNFDYNFLTIMFLVVIFIVGFAFTYFSLPKLIFFMKSKGWVGKDIHKNSRPEVAESGGLSILIGLIITSSLLILFFPALLNEIIIYLISIVLAGIIGLFDDRIKLRSRYKILLTLFTGVIIFIANLPMIGFIDISSPTIPFLGQTRLTIIYPFTIPIIVTIFANTVNMLEGYNGEGSGTVLIASCFLFVCALIWNSFEAIIFLVPFIAVLIPFFIYNKFPAKVFPGDVGTLTMGISLACIALFGSIEFPVIVALLLHIFNSFYIISSVRGFSESSEISLENKSDILLLNNNKIKASEKKNSALTIPRLILAKGPLSEPELVKRFFSLSIICGFLSIIGTLLMRWSTGTLDLITFLIFTVVLTIPIIILFYLYPRIRGISFLIVGLLIIGIFFMIFLDTVVMPFFTGVINLIFIRIPVNIIVSLVVAIPGFMAWYIITIKYFWYEIKRMNQ